MVNLKFSNELLVDSTPDAGDMPEDRNFVNPIDDEELGRTNPKRYDRRHDWYNSVNEHGNDSAYENRYEITEVVAKNKSRNKMKNWRNVFAAAKDEEFDGYKTDNGTELPNNAEFTGDKNPSGGEPAAIENKAWAAGDKEGAADRKRENAASDNGSALMGEKSKREDVGSHMKVKAGWRGVFADFNLKKKEDGSLEVNITDEPAGSLEDESVEIGPPPNIAPTLNSEPSVQASADGYKEWSINKKGSLELVGRECATHAAIAILDKGKEVMLHKVAKRGNSWREVIAQGVYESEMENM